MIIKKKVKDGNNYFVKNIWEFLIQPISKLTEQEF